MQTKTILQWAALLGALAVALGAFGAHGLRSVATETVVATFETAVRYHFYHVFALLTVGVLAPHFPHGERQWHWAAGSFLVGIFIFSGSLYLLTASKVNDWGLNWLGAVTPLGGLAFIAGWIGMAVAVRK